MTAKHLFLKKTLASIVVADTPKHPWRLTVLREVRPRLWRHNVELQHNIHEVKHTILPLPCYKSKFIECSLLSSIMWPEEYVKAFLTEPARESQFNSCSHTVRQRMLEHQHHPIPLRCGQDFYSQKVVPMGTNCWH